MCNQGAVCFQKQVLFQKTPVYFSLVFLHGCNAGASSGATNFLFIPFTLFMFKDKIKKKKEEKEGSKKRRGGCKIIKARKGGVKPKKKHKLNLCFFSENKPIGKNSKKHSN